MKKCTSPSSPSFPLHYYHQDRAPSGFFFPAAVSPAEDAFSTYYNLANKLNIPDAPTASSLAPTKMKAAAHNSRKDRHSKIVTAQGPRDRRVRLSIQVARKFFDLHDTLGSDKASETIDWLLTKSQPAIDELVRIKQSSCTTGDEGCSRSDSNEAAEIRDRHYMKSKSSMILSNSIDDDTQGRRVSMQLEEKARIASLVARESRAKARARARERTRQKMCIRHLFQTNKLLPRDFRIPGNHLSTWNELSYLDKIRRPT